MSNITLLFFPRLIIVLYIFVENVKEKVAWDMLRYWTNFGVLVLLLMTETMTVSRVIVIIAKMFISLTFHVI